MQATVHHAHTYLTRLFERSLLRKGFDHLETTKRMYRLRMNDTVYDTT